jgi:hypothetical protein
MAFLDLFALLVLCLLILSFVAIWVVLGMMPGRIARARKHPQADAINVCGWWGALTLGLLMPVAYIWAYTTARSSEQADADSNERATK